MQVFNDGTDILIRNSKIDMTEQQRLKVLYKSLRNLTNLDNIEKMKLELREMGILNDKDMKDLEDILSQHISYLDKEIIENNKEIEEGREQE